MAYELPADLLAALGVSTQAPAPAPVFVPPPGPESTSEAPPAPDPLDPIVVPIPLARAAHAPDGRQFVSPFRDAWKKREAELAADEQTKAAQQKQTALEAPISPKPYGSEAAVSDLGHRAQALRGQAIDVNTDLVKQSTAAQGEFLADQRLLDEQLQAKKQFIAAEKESRVKLATAERAQLLEDIKNTELNPNRLYANASTGQKVAGALAVFWGGVLMPSMGKNPALEIIDRALDRDLKVQMAKLENKKALFQMKGDLLGDLYKQFGDKESAVDAWYAIQYRGLQNQLDQKLNALKDPAQAAEALKAKAELQGMEQQANLSFMERQQKRAMLEEDKRRFGVETGLRARAQKEQERHNRAGESIDAYNAETQRYRTEAEVELGKAKEKATQPGPGEVSGEAVGGVVIQTPKGEQKQVVIKNEATRKNATQLIDSTRTSIQKLKDLKDVGADYNLLNDEQKAIANTAFTGLQLAYAQKQAGAETEKDAERIRDMFGGTMPQSGPQMIQFWKNLNPDQRSKVLDYVRDGLESNANNSLEVLLPGLDAKIRTDDIPTLTRKTIRAAELSPEQSIQEAVGGAYSTKAKVEQKDTRTKLVSSEFGETILKDTRKAINEMRGGFLSGDRGEKLARIANLRAQLLVAAEQAESIGRPRREEGFFIPREGETPEQAVARRKVELGAPRTRAEEEVVKLDRIGALKGVRSALEALDLYEKQVRAGENLGFGP